MLTRRKVAVVALLGIGVVVLLRLGPGVHKKIVEADRLPTTISTRATSTQPTDPARHAPISEAPARGTPSTAVSVAPRTVRTELPRIPAEHYHAGLRSLTQLEDPPGPVDRRPNPGPHAARELEALRYGLQTLDEDIATCLKQWNDLEARDAGNVLIGFRIDAQGLQESWIQSNTEVPFGPRTCFANAVYGIDWSHIVERPVEITNRFELSAQDGGRDMEPRSH